MMDEVDGPSVRRDKDTEKHGKRNIFDDLLPAVENSSDTHHTETKNGENKAEESVQHLSNSPPASDGNEAVKEKSISQEALSNLKDVCSFGVKLCLSKGSSLNAENVDDTALPSNQELNIDSSSNCNESIQLNGTEMKDNKETEGGNRAKVTLDVNYGIDRAQGSVDDNGDKDNAQESDDDNNDKDKPQESVNDINDRDKSQEAVDDINDRDKSQEAVDDINDRDKAEGSVDDDSDKDKAEGSVDDINDKDKPQESVDDINDKDKSQEAVDDINDRDKAEGSVDDINDKDKPRESVDDDSDKDKAEGSVDDINDKDKPQESVDDINDKDKPQESVEDDSDKDKAEGSVDDINDKDKALGSVGDINDKDKALGSVDDNKDVRKPNEFEAEQTFREIHKSELKKDKNNVAEEHQESLKLDKTPGKKNEGSDDKKENMMEDKDIVENDETKHSITKEENSYLLNEVDTPVQDKSNDQEEQNQKDDDLDCEDSQNLVIDIQEDNNEPPSESDQEKQNFNLDSNDSNIKSTESETTGLQLGTCEGNSVSVPGIENANTNAAADVEIISNNDKAESNQNTENDITGFKQKKDNKGDKQIINEEGVEEIQSLLQEFVNSSSKPQTMLETGKAVDQTNTEAVWSAVGLERCSYCLFTTDQKDLLKTHMSSCTRKNKKKEEIRLVYSNDGKYGCKNCLFTTPQKKKFEEHVAFHILADPYFCLTCMVTYSSKKEIEKHVQQVHSNNLAKCGLKGSKKIHRIIEDLYIKKEVAFFGRKIEKSELNTMVEQKQGPDQSVTKPPEESQLEQSRSHTILSVPNFPVFASCSSTPSPNPIYSSSSSVPVLSLAGTVASSNLPVATSINQFVIDQPLTFPTQPTARGPVLCNVVNSQSQPVPNLPVFASCSSTISPNPIYSSSSSVPVLSLAGTVASSNLPVIATSINQSVIGQPKTFPKQPTARGPVLCNVVNSQSQPVILVPVQPIQPGGVLAGPFQLKSGQGQPIQSGGVLAGPFQLKSGQGQIGSRIQPVSQPQFSHLVNIRPAPPKLKTATSQNQGQRLIVVSAANSPMQSIRHATNSVQTYEIQKTNLAVPPTITMHSTNVEKPADSTDAAGNNQSALLKLSVNQGGSSTKAKNQLLFKKTGQVYSCLSCNFNSDIEENFVKHIWVHVHQNVCKEREHQGYRQNIYCKLVSKMMQGLNYAAAAAEVEARKKASKSIPPEEIILSSDDEDAPKEVTLESPPSEKVFEEAALNSDNDLQIKITSTFSLSEPDTVLTGTKEDISNEKDSENPEKESVTEPSQTREAFNHLLVSQSVTGREDSEHETEQKRKDTAEEASNVATSEIPNKGNEHENISLCSGNESDLLRNDRNPTFCLNEGNDPSFVENESEVMRQINKAVGTPMKFYQCGFEGCNFSGITSTDFREHTTTMHSGAKEFNCAHCGHKSYTEECHFRHISCHAKNQSGLLFKCGRGCKYASNILKHFKEHLEVVHPSLDSYKCTSCQELFDNIGGLVNHCETNKLQFVLCPYCTMRDPNRRTILKHISTIHPGKPRQITVTAQLVCQEREINSYTAPKPISPPTKPVSPARNLEESREVVKPLVDLPVDIDTIKVEGKDPVDDDELKQAEGSEYEQSLTELNISTPAEDRLPFERTGLGSLIRCNKCTYLAGSNLLLRKHKLQHVRVNDKSRPFCCPVCPTSSDSIMKFERHINLHEGHHEIEIYMCELCNYQTNVREKIKFHLRKSHKGSDILNDYRKRLLTISVTVYPCEICENLYKSRKEYVMHMSKHDSSKLKSNTPVSIDKYHCDCCSFSCDDKNSLIQHTKVHLVVSNATSPSIAADEVKLKPKQSYNGPRKPYFIPPGNVFKDFIHCSECPFKTKTRLDLLRHIKCHQNLEPKMKKIQKKEVGLSERTRDVVKFQFGKRKHMSDSESRKRRKTIDSDSESVEAEISDTDSTVLKRKQVAVKSTSGAKNAKQSNLYFLGRDILHKKLQPCFTKEEDEPMFQCVMCSDVFEDKYSLHKHILDHMNISFHICNYCDKGELEISAMVTHIQKTHRKPIKHSRVKLEEIEDDINRAIHGMKAKEYWGESESIPDVKPALIDQVLSSPKEQSKSQSPNSTGVQNSPIFNNSKIKENMHSTPEKNKLPECVIPFGSGYKCTVCNQQAAQSYVLVRHAMTHCSVKRFLCPYCEKRSHYRSDICKHIHTKHDEEEVRVAFDKTNVEADSHFIALPIMQQILAAPDHESIRTVVKKEVEDKTVENVPIREESGTNVSSTDTNDKKGKKVVVGFRSVYKCLLCKTTFKGKGKIYKHLRETKCKRPVWRCSACKTKKFRSDKEKVIKDHIKEVHSVNKDAKPVLCALNGKIRKHTMPITVPKDEAKTEVKPKEEFESEETIKEKELNGAIATVLKRDDLWKCSNCDYITNSRANCVRHTFTHSIFKKFGCPVCSFRAKSSRSVKNHLRNCHPCERIRYKIYTEVNNSPKKQMKDESPIMSSPQQVSYQCRDCGFVSERKSSLSKHINAKCHAPLKRCSKCEFMTSNEDEMKNHVKQSHKAATVTNVPLSEKIMTLTSEDGEGSFKKVEKAKKSLSLRIKPLIKSPISKPLSNEMKMWSEENEEQSISCPVCNEIYYDLKGFRDHFAIEHKGKKLLCGECEEYAAHLPSLIFRHARLFHNQTRLEELNIRAVSQKTIEEKGLHQRLVILYRCPKCGKVLRRCPLRKHMYTHYNYNPYQCNHCDMKCKMPKKIQMHLSKIHPNKSITDFSFRKNLKLEKEISSILDSCRYQTLSRKSHLSATFGKSGQSTTENSIAKSTREIKEGKDQDAGSDNNEEEEEEDIESEDDEEDEPRGDLKNMFSPCHNYKVEFDNRRQRTIYKCSICPYQSAVNKTIVNHFYHHVPHVFKCPYCDFQCYPRSKIANHIVKLHPGKAVHVVDLRLRMRNLKFRNYEKRKLPSKTKLKQHKVKSDLGVGSMPKKDLPTAVSRKRKELDETPEPSRDVGKLQYLCNFCNHLASGLYHYRQHLASHEGFKHLVPGTQIESRLKCGYCSYLAVNDDDFKSHMEYHFATRPFSCPYCPFSQYRASGITYHIKRSHPGKPVDVVKESDSSFRIGQEVDAKAMLVDFEPKLELTDIFAMDPEDFEKLLSSSGVCVIDLNCIPYEKFDAVSKTLGLENQEREALDEPCAKRVKREPIQEEEDKLEENEDLETMIAKGELKIEENQKYDDVSDDEFEI